MGMSPLSPTPMPNSVSSSMLNSRPMSSMSQPTSAMTSGQGFLPSHLPPGALPLPGLTPGSGSGGYPTSQQKSSAYTNGCLNGPVSQSSPRMISNAEEYYYNKY